MQKTSFLLALFIGSMFISHAQFYKTVGRSDAFADSLTRIVQDFKENFYPIQGRQLAAQGPADVYQSSVGMPGAIHCIIQRYHSAEDTTASWQAIMYEGDHFEEAVKVYKSTYRQLKKARIKSAGDGLYTFTGEMEMPDKALRFAVSPLRLNTPDEDYKFFYAEVEITSGYYGWEVHLNFHNKKNDDSEY